MWWLSLLLIAIIWLLNDAEMGEDLRKPHIRHQDRV